MLTDLSGEVHPSELMGGKYLRLAKKLAKMPRAKRRKYWRKLKGWQKTLIIAAAPFIVPLIALAPVTVTRKVVESTAKAVKKSRKKRVATRKRRAAAAAAARAKVDRQEAAAPEVPEVAPGTAPQAAPGGLKLPPWLPLVGIGLLLLGE